MRIVTIHLKQFRCFADFNLEFTSPIAVLTGPNGIGKTSVLEALHYACYLKSFKTATAKELILLGAAAHQVTITVSCDPVSLDTISISYTPPKRTVRINNTVIHSFSDLYATYRAVTLTEDTLMIIKGSPSMRRSYLDQIVTLFDPAYAQELSRYRRILDNRNALLARYTGDYALYQLWTEQLWQASTAIEHKRKTVLAELQQELTGLTQSVDTDSILELAYKPYKSTLYKTSAEFLAQYPDLLKRETQQQRTLFGVHLDDFDCLLNNTSSRIYASRGQQKLITVLLALAQVQLLRRRQASVVLLLDDFLTDLDTTKAAYLLSLALPLASQTIITSPHANSFLETYLETDTSSYQAQIIRL